MPSKHISSNANTSNPLFNCPHAIKTHFIQCQHLKPPLQLLPCRRNIFHPVPTPHTPFSTAPVPSKHISPSANTSHALFNCPAALKTYFTQCQHLKPPFHLPPCPQNTFRTVPTPQTPFSSAPMPEKTHFTQCQHLKPPHQPPPCPQNIFHTVPTPQAPFSTNSASFEVLAPFFRVYEEISVLIVFLTQFGISYLFDLVFSRSPHFGFYLFQNSSTDLVRRCLVNRCIMLIASKCVR